jgi:CRISPR/Cas system-associated exonuclease Cas4 (RecB family)
MKISYSDYRTYLDCPRLYKLRADKVPPPEKESRYFALYGLLVERFFKKYTNEVARTGRVLTDDNVREVLREIWKFVLDTNYVNWDEPWVKNTSDEIFEMAWADVCENMRKFTFWKDARSEVSFNIKLKKSGDLITCRMDFVSEPSGGPVEILDGKGKMKIDTDADLEQLYFYALVYLLNKGKLPDKIGFLYYRFKLIKYIDFDAATIMSFRDKLALVKTAMKNDTEFVPKVGLSKQCKWCIYKSSCDAYMAKKQANAEKKAAKNGGPALAPTGELQDLSF